MQRRLRAALAACSLLIVAGCGASDAAASGPATDEVATSPSDARPSPEAVAVPSPEVPPVTVVTPDRSTPVVAGEVVEVATYRGTVRFAVPRDGYVDPDLMEDVLVSVALGDGDGEYAWVAPLIGTAFSGFDPDGEFVEGAQPPPASVAHMQAWLTGDDHYWVEVTEQAKTTVAGHPAVRFAATPAADLLEHKDQTQMLLYSWTESEIAERGPKPPGWTWGMTPGLDRVEWFWTVEADGSWWAVNSVDRADGDAIVATLELP